MSTLAINNGTVFTPTGPTQASLLINAGIITELAPEPLAAEQTIDATGHLIFPGFIDCHVHFREPGFPHKATMASEAKAARAGGVTTVCEMPNTNPPCFTSAVLADKVARAAQVTDCDIHFFFGATEPEHLANFKALWQSDDPLKQRCCGLKLFLENSTGDFKLADGLAEAAFKLCAEIDANITAHCEDPALNAAAAAECSNTDIQAHSQRRPPQSEAASIKMALDLVRQYGTRFHVAHLSTALGLELIKDAKAEGLPVTCEVCPHHLWFSTDDYARLGTHLKMNPPVRSPQDPAALWQGIADGIVDCLATDHAPHTIEEKATEDPLAAPSGVPGVEHLIPLLLTKAADGAITYQQIYQLCFINSNHIYRLNKDPIILGAQPDLVIVDPAAKTTITRSSVISQCGWSPYEDMEVVGGIEQVISGELFD